jgi:NADH-quinone oxidoreductase subunit F
VDLHLIPGADPTDQERAAVDGALGTPATGWEGARRREELEGHVAHGGRESRARRHLLLPALQAVQARVGWISPGALNYVCRRLTVPPADAYGVATFYSMLSVEPRPGTVVHICDDLVCRIAGARELCVEMTRRVGPAGSATKDGAATWMTSPCLGLCERAPAVLFQEAGPEPSDHALAPATAHQVTELMEGRGAAAPPVPARPTAGRLLRRVGRVDPESLDDYRAHGGYAALRRALATGPEGVIREVLDSKLVGRGGAAFPKGRKWDAVAKAAVRPHYVVCNADESEPGTFKDRVLMEEDPFAVVEAMTIAGYATASEQGYIYIRGEYPLATARISGAIAQARARGLLGHGVMGGGFRFDIELRRGAGAYICGEETALFNSIEGYRGEPRNKPPYPVQAGLFGKPTAINNVETLVNVLDILIDGGPAFASTGTAQSTGTKLFCVSGCVERAGVYEVPFGTTLRQLIDLAGGMRGGRPLRAVLLGGAAGSFVTPDQIDTPLTFEGVVAAGATLGSGAVIVFDEGVDLEDIVLRIAAFFRDESCGQCVPCRVGTQRQEELLARLAGGRARGSVKDETALLDEIVQAMRDASICGLGQTAGSAARSAIEKLGLFKGGGPA